MVPIRLKYSAYEPISGVDPNLSPVIFLHGICAYKEYWGDIPQNIANATKRRTYALDARNHGDSDWSDEFNFDLNAYDLLHFLDTEKIRRVILVGHSMGGTTAIKAALMRPQNIEKIIVEDMYVKIVPQEIMDAIVLYISLAREGLEIFPKDLDENGAKNYIMDYIHSKLPEEVQNMRRGDKASEDNHILSLRKDEKGHYVSKCNLEIIEKALRDTDSVMTPAIGKYEGPACFIYGKLSPFKVDTEEEHIKEHFPNAVFECIEEATHTVHGDCPVEFTDVLLKHIS